MLIWLNLTIKQSLILNYSKMSFIGPKMLLEYLGAPIEIILIKTKICIVFEETKKKKPIFHNYLIVFAHKKILAFWIFPISLL